MKQLAAAVITLVFAATTMAEVPEPTFKLANLPTVQVKRASPGPLVTIIHGGEYQMVRLLGVADSPDAHEAIRELLPEGEAYLAIPQGAGRDSRDRLRVYLLDPGGRCINFQLVKSGAARADLSGEYPGKSYVEACESAARSANAGVWEPYAAPESAAPGPGFKSKMLTDMRRDKIAQRNAAVRDRAERHTPEAMAERAARAKEQGEMLRAAREEAGYGMTPDTYVTYGRDPRNRRINRFSSFYPKDPTTGALEGIDRSLRKLSIEAESANFRNMVNDAKRRY